MNSKVIITLLIICGLLTVDCGLTYAQTAKLKVPGDVTAQSIILDPQPSKTPLCQEGQVYYDNNTDQPYYCDGNNWIGFGGDGGNRTVGTKIVAAYNSLGSKESDGSTCEVGDTTCNNPKADYTCTGSNDHQKINDAINALTSGGAVYLLEGTYNISASIVPKNNIAIMGAGKSTILKASGNINVINASSGNYILISQLIIVGDNAANSGISFSNVGGSKINKVGIVNTLDKGISLLSSSYNTISKVTVTGASINNGIELLGSSNNIISNNNINTKSGIFLGVGCTPTCYSSHNNIVFRNSIYAPFVSVHIKDGSANNIISANYIEKSGALDASYGITIENNCSTNKISGNHIINTGIKLDLNSSQSTISNNTITQTQSNQDGIYVGTARNVITNNIISSSTGNGIRIQDNGASYPAEYNLISSNLIKSFGTDANDYGISIIPIGAYYINFNYLAGNFILGPADKRIYDPFSSQYYATHYTDKTRIGFEANPWELLDPSSGDLDPGVKSYVTVASSRDGVGFSSVRPGKYPGDILIINATPYAWWSYYIFIPNNANTQLYNDSNKYLYESDIISLIWNGQNWIQTGGKK